MRYRQATHRAENSIDLMVGQKLRILFEIKSFLEWMKYVWTHPE